MNKEVSGKINIFWFRQDLRLEDNPALQAALKTRLPLMPLYIWDPEGEGEWLPGGASRWWLHRSLESLHLELVKRGSALVLQKGNSEKVFLEILSRYSVQGIYWNHRYEPLILNRDKELKNKFESRGIRVEVFHGSVLFPPDSVLKEEGTPYKVFTPFWKRCLRQTVHERTSGSPSSFPPVPSKSSSLPLEKLKLNPAIAWDTGLKKTWQPGSPQALAQLEKFLKERLSRYPESRDRPDQEGTSRLSPYLHFGEISPLRIWNACRKAELTTSQPGIIRGSETFLRELGWREFGCHLLIHFPHTPQSPLREEFNKFPWRTDIRQLEAWQQGQTGYPIIDAGMRQLWQTGWMHNRVRMIVASFLVKDLLHSWQEGSKWFWETLVDADLANNTFGWQWAGGCGADAAPFFRIFNPILQGEKFDSLGTYVKTFCPELRELPPPYIHHPWLAPDPILKSAGITLGKNYPSPIIDHSLARTRALQSFSMIKK